jgi:hypothetical protein
MKNFNIEVITKNVDTVRVVAPAFKFTVRLFKSKLIEHFDILWKQNKIVWPSHRNVAK